jgi:hypothetical protein
MNTKMNEENWIVYCGTILDTTKGGGLEFFGPFSEASALEARTNMVTDMTASGHIAGTFMCEAVELLHWPK